MNVRERTEEICTVTEKIKAYEIIIQKGNRELTIREMERTKLNALLEEVKKRAVIIIAKQPNEKKITEEIESLRQELCVVTNERRIMEAELNDVSNPNRLRNVHHELIEQRETVPMLQEKLSKLEEALANRECEALERELVLKQVTEITEDSMMKANLLKETYSEHTNLLCTLRKQLYHMSYKIDGMISEASIAITQADLAEKRYQELAEELAKAEKRFCIGLPPVDSMLEEWNHSLWKKEMLRRSNENKNRRFLREGKPLSGSRIVMERLRPRKRTCVTMYSNSPCSAVGLPRLL
jgi:chromosome segregation ATPase